MGISSAADTFVQSRRRDLLMVSTVVLFPLMLLQFGFSVLVLRFADSSAVVALAVPQIVSLILTAVVLAAGVWLVMAALLPFVVALQSGEEITADDALKAFPRSLRSMPPKGDADAAPSALSLYGALVLAYLAVIGLTALVTGNELTIGMAFLEMTGLFVAGVALTPPIAVTLLMVRLGLVQAPVPAAEAPPAPDTPSTSVPPPGAAPADPPAAASPPPVAGPPDLPPAPPPAGGRGSVPPPS